MLRLLGVKPHVLRYWEQSVPLIRPRRNESGHRVWSAAQLRMLLRLRHLVSNRGMSVTAAGDALLREAEPSHADAKARLEALRGGLVAVLMKTRVDGTARVDGSFRAGGAPRTDETTIADVALPREHDSSDDDPAHEGSIVAGPRSTPDFLDADALNLDTLLASDLAATHGAISSPRHPTPMESDRIAVIPVSHLFAHLPHAHSAELLHRLLVHRCASTREGSSSEPSTVVVPVPAAAVEVYRTVLAPWMRDRPVHLVPLAPLRYRGLRWWSPRLALFVALATDPYLERWLTHRRIRGMYLFALDDATVPVVPSPALREAAAADPSGLAMTAARIPRGVRIVEATLLDRDHWFRIGAQITRTARRRFVLPHDGLVAAEGRASRPAVVTGGWRYDVWLQDLYRFSSSIEYVPATPAPWRGAAWDAEVRRLWPHLFAPGDEHNRDAGVGA